MVVAIDTRGFAGTEALPKKRASYSVSTSGSRARALIGSEVEARRYRAETVLSKCDGESCGQNVFRVQCMTCIRRSSRSIKSSG